MSYSILYSGTVTVPQSCGKSTGQTILVGLAHYTAAISTMQAKAGGYERKIQRTGKCGGLDSQVNLQQCVLYRYAG